MGHLIDSIHRRKSESFLILVVILLYYLNNVLIKPVSSGLIHRFFVCYFNDLMAPIFLLSYSNILLDTQGKELGSLRQIEFFCLCSGAVWEFAAPMLKEGSITDLTDLICYLTGGYIYWRIIQMKGSDHDRGKTHKKKLW